MNKKLSHIESASEMISHVWQTNELYAIYGVRVTAPSLVCVYVLVVHVWVSKMLNDVQVDTTYSQNRQTDAFSKKKKKKMFPFCLYKHAHRSGDRYCCRFNIFYAVHVDASAHFYNVLDCHHFVVVIVVCPVHVHIRIYSIHAYEQYYAC